MRPPSTAKTRAPGNRTTARMPSWVALGGTCNWNDLARATPWSLSESAPDRFCHIRLGLRGRGSGRANDSVFRRRLGSPQLMKRDLMQDAHPPWARFLRPTRINMPSAHASIPCWSQMLLSSVLAYPAHMWAAWQSIAETAKIGWYFDLVLWHGDFPAGASLFAATFIEARPTHAVFATARKSRPTSYESPQTSFCIHPQAAKWNYN